MHDHDLDLIAEHASGLLTGADATRAAELVRSCPECAREFDTHREIQSLLADAPAPMLSELERTRLRRSVLDAAAPARPTSPGWTQRFLAVAGAVAAVAVVTVGIGVLGQSGQDEGMTLADGGEAATTSADALIPPAADEDGPMRALSERSEEEEAGAFDDDAGDAVSDDAAVAEALPNLLIDAGEVSQDQLDSVLGELSAVMAETEAVVSPDEAVAFGATCAPEVDEAVLGVVLATVDGVPTQVFLTGDPAEPSVLMLTTEDCAAPSS